MAKAKPLGCWATLSAWCFAVGIIFWMLAAGIPADEMQMWIKIIDRELKGAVARLAVDRQSKSGL